MADYVTYIHCRDCRTDLYGSEKYVGITTAMDLRLWKPLGNWNVPAFGDIARCPLCSSLDIRLAHDKNGVDWRSDETYTGEPILAWRAFNIHTDPGLEYERLAAITRGRPAPPLDKAPWRLTSWGISPIISWPNHRLEAVCLRGFRHTAPSPSCGCGMWGFREREQLLRAISPSLGTWAIARVHLWGRIVEQERGLRAQYAYPYEVECFNVDEEILRELRNFYRIDMTAGKMLEEPRSEEKPAPPFTGFMYVRKSGYMHLSNLTAAPPERDTIDTITKFLMVGFLLMTCLLVWSFAGLAASEGRVGISIVDSVLGIIPAAASLGIWFHGD